jgi:hypothetical protein
VNADKPRQPEHCASPGRFPHKEAVKEFFAFVVFQWFIFHQLYPPDFSYLSAVFEFR